MKLKRSDIYILEVKNYFNKFTISVYIFLLIQLALTNLISFRNAKGILDLNTIKIINYNLSASIFSGIPTTILVYLSREFSSGFSSKLIGLGLTRRKYFWDKIKFIFLYSILLTILYSFSILLIYVKFKSWLSWFDLGLYIFTFFLIVSCLNLIATFVSFIFSDWRIGITCYLGYSFLESTIVFAFKDNATFLNLLPMNVLVSTFQFESGNSTIGINISQFIVIIIFMLTLGFLGFTKFKLKDH